MKSVSLIYISHVSRGNAGRETHFRDSARVKNARESSLELRDREARDGPVDYRSRRIINCLQRGTIPWRLIIRPYRTCRRLIDSFDRSVFSVAAERLRARAPANRQLIDRPINHLRAFEYRGFGIIPTAIRHSIVLFPNRFDPSLIVPLPSG